MKVLRYSLKYGMVELRCDCGTLLAIPNNEMAICGNCGLMYQFTFSIRREKP